ncbi:MAG: hypothetical protein M3Z17_09400 [Gemmatimonadota bacterium]|nr:hypothetical protein [Gemmatimonadota bacterium]
MMRSLLKFLTIVAGLAFGGVAILFAYRTLRPEPDTWHVAGPVGRDSLSRALRKRIGAAPDTMESCGPRRVRIVYVNAPIDPRFPSGAPPVTAGRRDLTSDNRDSSLSDAHEHVAELVALVAWIAGARRDAIDTISIKLVRTRGEYAEFGNHNFIRNPRELRGGLTPIGAGALACVTIPH